jgi:UrcA family protein
MYSKFSITTFRFVLGAAACALAVSNVAAKDHIVPVSAQVSTQGLDLSRPADVQTFYTRLQNAAWMVCTRGTRADLLPSDNLKGCYEKALGDAVRSAKKPLLTQLYLGNHTLQEAAAHGIEVPQVAAK